jgi:hypothetical protein
VGRFVTGSALVGFGVDNNMADDDAVFNLESRKRPETALPRALRSYGTISCGYETMKEAWPALHHVFSVGAPADPGEPTLRVG